MKHKDKLEVVLGSGNVFRDLGRIHADADQFKAILATEIIKTLDREHLTVRAAQARTGIATANFSRIRHADLGRRPGQNRHLRQTLHGRGLRRHRELTLLPG